MTKTAKLTINDILPNVRRGVAANILRHLETSTTITIAEATKKAAWQHLSKSRSEGAAENVLHAIVLTYATVGAWIAADAARQS